MKMRWEEIRRGSYRGLSDEGHQLAQVAHVVGPNGADNGWMVWLNLQKGELFDRYPSAEAAMTAAEAAIDPDTTR